MTAEWDRTGKVDSDEVVMKEFAEIIRLAQESKPHVICIVSIGELGTLHNLLSLKGMTPGDLYEAAGRLQQLVGVMTEAAAEIEQTKMVILPRDDDDPKSS